MRKWTVGFPYIKTRIYEPGFLPNYTVSFLSA